MSLIRMLFLPGCLVVTLSACGSSDATEKVAPEGAAAAFHGVWDGAYKKLDADGLQLKQTHAKAEFIATEETSGTFEFRFPEEGDSATKGEFQVFNHTTLILEIDESNYSGIGLTGSVASMGFELSKNALLLDDEGIEIVMVRDEDGSIGSDTDADTPSAKSVKGRWACVDKASNSWDLFIDDQNFNISVSGSGSSYFIMNGKINTKNEQFSAASLLIEHASYTTYIGRSLNVTRTDKGLDVIMISQDRQLDQFSCDAK